MADRRYRVCVIGAGIIGLSTAYRLKEAVPDVDITIVAEEFSPNTTGDGSAGFWRPFLLTGMSDELVWKWGKETFDHLHALSCSAEGGVLQIFQATGYDLYKQFIPEAFWKDIVFGYRSMSSAELQQFPGGYRCGYAYTTMMCTCKHYLPWLLSRFLDRGGKKIQKKVHSLAEVAGDYDVIVNCSGVGARHLVNDNEVEPLKGQLIKVEAPWLKHFVVAHDDDLYILVGVSSVALGGSHDNGDWSRTIDPAHRQRIWQGCCRLMPSLQKAKVIEEWAGLRPSRNGVRHEAEELTLGNKSVKVVHSYGHGGSGVTLHWGCAGDTVQLIKQSLGILPLHAKL